MKEEQPIVKVRCPGMVRGSWLLLSSCSTDLTQPRTVKIGVQKVASSIMVPGRETLTSEIRACLGGARADSGLRPSVSSRNVSLCGSLPWESLLGPRRLWLESHVFLHLHIQIVASSGCKDALEQS